MTACIPGGSATVIPVPACGPAGGGGGGGGTDDHQAPNIIVGNALSGDTADKVDHLDPGDGTGIAAAMAALLTAGGGHLYIRPGAYTLDTAAIAGTGNPLPWPVPATAEITGVSQLQVPVGFPRVGGTNLIVPGDQRQVFADDPVLGSGIFNIRGIGFILLEPSPGAAGSFVFSTGGIIEDVVVTQSFSPPWTGGSGVNESLEDYVIHTSAGSGAPSGVRNLFAAGGQSVEDGGPALTLLRFSGGGPFYGHGINLQGSSTALGLVGLEVDSEPMFVLSNFTASGLAPAIQIPASNDRNGTVLTNLLIRGPSGANPEVDDRALIELGDPGGATFTAGVNIANCYIKGGGSSGWIGVGLYSSFCDMSTMAFDEIENGIYVDDGSFSLTSSSFNAGSVDVELANGSTATIGFCRGIDVTNPAEVVVDGTSTLEAAHNIP